MQLPAIHLVDQRSSMYTHERGSRKWNQIFEDQDAHFRSLSLEERKSMFKELGNILMEQRKRLLRYRERTGQSATFDADSVISELLAALVVGNPGTCRKGKDGGVDLIARDSTGQLIDSSRPTEQVKKGYRLDPMIDFRMSGVLRNNGTRLELVDGFPDNFNTRHAAVLCAHASNIQPLKTYQGRLITANEIWRLRTSKTLTFDVSTNTWSLNFGRSVRASDAFEDGQHITFDLKQERGKVDFGPKTQEQLTRLLQSQPVIVHTHHDRRARPVIAVFALQPNQLQITNYIDSVAAYERCSNTSCATPYARTTPSCPNCDRINAVSVQPYLFRPADSAREEIKDDYGLLGARLVAHGHLGREGFNVDFFDFDNGLSMEAGGPGQALLLRVATDEECPDLTIEPLSDKEAEPTVFVETCIHKFYREMIPFLDCANITRNMIGGSLAEHLQCLVHGGEGTRTDSKGPDLVESGMPLFDPPNLLSTANIDRVLSISEIKLATGGNGDMMGVEDNATRLNLGSSQSKMASWKHLLPVRIVHDFVEGKEVLQVATFRPSQGQMEQFRTDVAAYFAANPDSTNLQYHAGRFDRNWFGTETHRLECDRTFEYCKELHESTKSNGFFFLLIALVFFFLIRYLTRG